MISSLNLNPEEVLLGQGTLRPDLIESASHLVSGKADTIKTHRKFLVGIFENRFRLNTSSFNLLFLMIFR